ncbi:unnamed protein product [Ectocarpus sp. CCAP 1310/34]|nr:unnamed protein product [Ectocarpus sp. CCAP 1310/34]
MVGDFNSRVGKASSRGQAIGQHGEDKVNDNGVRMLEFLGSNELMVLNGRRACDKPEFIRQRVVCNEHSILDYILVDRGSTQIPELHVDVQAAGDRVIEGWESTVNTTAERVVGKEEVKGLVKKKSKCIWDEVVQKANGTLEGNVKQMWEGISGLVKKTAQGGDTGVATLRGVNGGLVSSGKGKREVLAGHYKRLGVPSENEAFDRVFKKVDAWGQKKEEETSKADVGNVELEKEFTEDEVEACVNKLKCHKAAGADGIVNEFMKFGGKGMIQLMVLLFRTKWGCVDHAFTVGRIIQGRKRAGKPTCSFVLDVKKAYDTVWKNGLWKQLSKYGIKGKMWRVLKKMTTCTKSAVMLDGELPTFFDIEQGVLQHAVPNNVPDGSGGVEELAVVDQYTYLGVEIAKDCSWNAHMSNVAEWGKARAGKLYPLIANRHLDTRIKLTVLKSVIVPPLEYAGEGRTGDPIPTVGKRREEADTAWQYRMCGMGEDRMPRNVCDAKWTNKKKGRQPTEWVKVVEDVWKGLDIDEDETLETEGLQGGITLLNTVGRVFCKLLNDRIVRVLDEERMKGEGHAGFRKKRGCVDHAFTVGRIIQGRKSEGKPTYCFFLDVKKAYDIDWRNGLWKQLSKYGIKVVPQGCTLCPTLFQVFINDLLEVVEAVEKGVVVKESTVSGMMFAGDFVGLSDTPEGLQTQIDAAKADRKRLLVECTHMSNVAERGKARAGKLHPVLANRHLDTRIKLTVMKSVIVPPLEYAGEMKAAKVILGCSKRTSNAAVRAELGIQSQRSGSDARKLTWQYRMCGTGEGRLPRIA